MGPSLCSLNLLHSSRALCLNFIDSLYNRSFRVRSVYHWHGRRQPCGRDQPGIAAYEAARWSRCTGAMDPGNIPFELYRPILLSRLRTF